MPPAGDGVRAGVGGCLYPAVPAGRRCPGSRGEQPYAVNGRTYRNVLGSFGPAAGPRLIIGAHYNVCGEQPGADDNGTGVAALLATLLTGQ